MGVDCDKKTGDQGCQGGLPSNAFKDMIQNKIGLETEAMYPYTARNGQCSASQGKEQVFISDWTAIITDEDQIAAALIKHGPLAIGINAGPMQFYTKGVAKPSKSLCNPKQLDHGVAIVGSGVDSGTKYWTIRNSWGAAWASKVITASFAALVLAASTRWWRRPAWGRPRLRSKFWFERRVGGLFARALLKAPRITILT